MKGQDEGSKFRETSRAISVLADCSPRYVVLLAKDGLVPHIVASNGTRLFPRAAAEIIKEIKKERLANRGFRRIG